MGLVTGQRSMRARRPGPGAGQRTAVAPFRAPSLTHRSPAIHARSASLACCAAPLRGQVATVGIHVLPSSVISDGPAGRKAFELFDELDRTAADLGPRTAGTMQKAHELLHPT